MIVVVSGRFHPPSDQWPVVSMMNKVSLLSQGMLVNLLLFARADQFCYFFIFDIKPIFPAMKYLAFPVLSTLNFMVWAVKYVSNWPFESRKKEKTPMTQGFFRSLLLQCAATAQLQNADIWF